MFEWIIIAVFAAALLAVGVIYIVKFFQLTPEEKKQKVLDLLYSLVVIAEKEIEGQGKGSEKLAYVEELFQKQAPMLYKLFIKYSGFGDLADLIEEALQAVKENFNKN